MFFLVGAIVILLGAVLLLIGVRGCVVGDDPHCRNCGFNLRGRDAASKRCPECGTELSDAAIRIGERRRRPTMASVGAVMLLVGLAGTGWTGWEFAQSHDWTPWKPTAWLVEDLDSADPMLPGRARRELIRRIESKDFPQAKVDALIDRMLDRQGDRSKTWNPLWGDVVDAAIVNKRIEPTRLARYLRQGVSATLEFKPKIRRGQALSLNLSLRNDRFGSNTRLRGTWAAGPMMLGDVVMFKPWAEQKQETDLAGGAGYGMSLDGSMWTAGGLPDGKHTLHSSVHYKVMVTQPAEAAAWRTEFDVPLSLPVELVPAGATVDEFKVDEARRGEMVKALATARVTHDEKNRVDVRVKALDPPVGVSADVYLTQDGAEQKVGGMRIDAGASRWCNVPAWPKPKFGGVVDVHLRPAQDPADATRRVYTYWGEEIVIRNVTVDAPYDPAFNRDESLRPRVEKSLKIPKLTRNSGASDPRWRIGANLSADAPAVKLSYGVYLRAKDGREVKLTRWDVSPSTGGVGYGTSGPDVDPEGKAMTCDVIYRPDRDWEIHTSDLTPPWGGEVIFRDVPIESSAK